MNYLLAFLVSLVLALGLTPLVEKFSRRVGAIDNPNEAARKIHQKIMPRAGGLVLYFVFMVCTLVFVPNRPAAFGGLVVSSTLVFLIGFWDDIHRLSPWTKLAVQLIAAVSAVLAYGIGVEVLTNPLGGHIFLNTQSVDVLNATVPLWSFIITVLWLVGMTNTINFLDGLDGLATGVSAIAAFILFIVSLLPRINQPTTALMAVILLGACLGFLRYNFHPARIFLGDSGAYFLGMVLGSLAVISGAKLATALLVLGIPVLDAIWSVVRRLAHKQSPFSADRGHIHYLLLDAGFTHRQVVLIIYALALAFGLVAIIGDGRFKLAGLVVLVCTMGTGIILLSWPRLKRRAIPKKHS